MTDKAAELIARLYERQLEHIQLHGEVKRSDKKIWEMIDQEMDLSALADVFLFAKDSPDFRPQQREWLRQVCERSPFYIRKTAEQNKSCDNNTKMWKLLMQMREVIDARLKEQANPRNNLFEFSTS